jgi:hypothetical protein
MGVMSAGCVNSGSGGRTGNDWLASLATADTTDVRLLPADEALRLQPEDTLAGPGCLNPLVDPRDGSTLTLVRSAGGYGVYAAPETAPGSGNRVTYDVHCNTGRVVTARPTRPPE